MALYNFIHIYILIVCTNVVSFFTPKVSSGSDFSSLAVEISVKSTGFQFCHALVLLNGLIHHITLFFHLCLHLLTSWRTLVWKPLSGSSKGHGATGDPGVGCVLPHRLCPARSACSGARLQTPALRGDQPGPGSNPGLQSGAKGETGPLRGPEESPQETAEGRPGAGAGPSSSGPLPGSRAGPRGQAPLRPAGVPRDLTDAARSLPVESRAVLRKAKHSIACHVRRKPAFTFRWHTAHLIFGVGM